MRVEFTITLNLLAWEALFGRAGRTERSGLGTLVHRLRKHVPYALVALAFILARRAVFPGPFGGDEPVRGIFVHYLTQTQAIVDYYLRLSLFPVGQNADREYAIVQGVSEGGFLLAASIAASIAFSSHWQAPEKFPRSAYAAASVSR